MKKLLAVEIVWSQLLLYGGELKTRKAIYEELLTEGHERRYVDWYLFCLAENQPKGNTMNEEQIKQVSELMNSLQADIQQAIERGKFLATIIARGTSGREVALCITQLQQAGHWLTEGQELFAGEEQSNP